MSLKKLDLLRIITSSNYLYNFSSSYSNKALTASYAMNGGGGGGTSGTSGASGTSGTSGTSGVSGTAGSSGTSATAGSSGTSGAGSSGTSGGGASLNTGSKYPITSSWSVKALTASYIANFPIINNVQAQIIVPSVTGSSYTLIRSVANSSDIFVSINGVVQIPSSSYTISGNTINFSQVPTSGSRIDVRFLLSGNNISSSYALTASYSSNGGGGGGGTTLYTGSKYPITSSYALNVNGNWTGSGFVTNDNTQSIAAFNSVGKPMLVKPTSDNVYLVVQNGVMKWIPIASVAVSIMTSNFLEDEVVLDGPVVPINATSFSNQNYTEEEQVVVGSLLTSVVILGSFTSGSI
jgi:hypothetical protein